MSVDHPGDSRTAQAPHPQGAAPVIDAPNYVPFLTTAIGNQWQRRINTLFRERFDLNVTDWRVLATLKNEPGIPANRICEMIFLDKAGVSRSLNQLAERKLVTFRSSPSDSRKRWWWLSKAGIARHDELMALALTAETEMLAGLTQEELDISLRAMRVMLSNLG